MSAMAILRVGRFQCIWRETAKNKSLPAGQFPIGDAASQHSGPKAVDGGRLLIEQSVGFG
jgi:hypothetical protein